MQNRLIIIGKPNVGKSSIFNMIINKNIALVDNHPGLTRDLRKKRINLWDKDVEIIDSPGLVLSKNNFEKEINDFTIENVKLSNIVLLVFDAKSELTSEDFNIIELIRKLNKKTVIVLNKCDIRNHIKHNIEGFGKKFFISASHNIGIDDLKWEIHELLDETINERENVKHSIAIVGKTNTGKSTIFNLLNKKITSQTSEIPNMTRDSVESYINFNNLTFKAFDTAGFSRGNERYVKVNRISMEQTLKKIRLSQLVVVVLDINNYYEKINSKIINHIFNENRCLLLLVNKIDTQKFVSKVIEKHIYQLNPQIRGIPICFVSAKKNIGFKNFGSLLFNQLELWKNRIKTSKLNFWLNEVVTKNPHPMKSGNPVKFKFISQVNMAPPKFFIFTNYPDFVKQSYKRFLSNNLKNYFNLRGLPIKILFKKSVNPYEKN